MRLELLSIYGLGHLCTDVAVLLTTQSIQLALLLCCPSLIHLLLAAAVWLVSSRALHATTHDMPLPTICHYTPYTTTHRANACILHHHLQCIGGEPC